ncbi:unnamed protein product [Somion occarium]|uniref:Uncharacterized protein n=1 Tax=Somion occarium TaxID=3059160 RepID=A0ABP1CZL5_9APHY
MLTLHKNALLWRWDDDPLGSGAASEAQKQKQSALFSHRIAALYAHESLPDYVLLVGDQGQVTLTDLDLNVKASHQPVNEGETLVNAFIFSRDSCSFAPTRTCSRQGAVLVLVSTQGENLIIQSLSLDPDGVVIPLGTSPISSFKGTILLNISCSASGLLTILESNGTLHSFLLESPDQDSIVVNITTDPIHLRSLTVIKSTQESSSLHFNEIAILSLTASHVLLAGVTFGAAPEIILLLLDMQYSVVLASHTLNIPSSVSRSKKQGMQIRLVGGRRDHDQALLLLSPDISSAMANGASDAATLDSSARSSIFVVPIAVPKISTIANAMGRASLTAKWLGQTDSQVDAPAGDLDSSQNKLLNVMRTAMEQKRVDAADRAFFQWVTEHDASTAQKPSYLSHRFVQQILEIVFRQPKGSNATSDIPYSPKVVRTLLEKKAVTSGMLERGLLSALRPRHDWDSMVTALTSVIDIPEDDVVSFLHEVILAQQKRQPAGGEDAMQVDSSANPDLPSLRKVLSLIVVYPVTAPAMRLAIRQQLKDAEELDAILEVIVQWIEEWCSEDPRLLPEQVKKDERGITVPIYTSKPMTDLPALDKVLAFLQILLDSSALAFLSHPHSQRLIRQIFSLLEPEISFNDSIEQLRGPLEPFAKAHAKAASDVLHGTQKQDPKVDWRKRKKAAHEQAAVAIGVYQVEELVL